MQKHVLKVVFSATNHLTICSVPKIGACFHAFYKYTLNHYLHFMIYYVIQWIFQYIFLSLNRIKNSFNLPNTISLYGILNFSSLSSWYETWHSYSPESFNWGFVSLSIQTLDPSLWRGEYLLSWVYNISPMVNIFKSLRRIQDTYQFIK